MLRRHKRTEKKKKRADSPFLQCQRTAALQGDDPPIISAKDCVCLDLAALTPSSYFYSLFVRCIQRSWGKEGVEDPKLLHHAHRGRAQDQAGPLVRVVAEELGVGAPLEDGEGDRGEC